MPLVTVPIVVVIIQIVPELLPKSDGSGGDTFYIAGTQFNADIAFNNVTVVVEQAQELSGEQLPESSIETLNQAMVSLEAREFAAAIQLLESVEEQAPGPNQIRPGRYPASQDFFLSCSFSQSSVGAVRPQHSLYSRSQSIVASLISIPT